MSGQHQTEASQYCSHEHSDVMTCPQVASVQNYAAQSQGCSPRAIIREELAPLLKTSSARSIEDRLLSAAQAAEVLQVSERWLYKHADRLPYAVKLSGTVVRFSYNKIQ